MAIQFDGVYFLDPSSGTRYYYSPTGNDSNAGTAPTTAWVTLSKTPALLTYVPTYYILGF